jgi:hypothetical protein
MKTSLNSGHQKERTQLRDEVSGRKKIQISYREDEKEKGCKCDL